MAHNKTTHDVCILKIIVFSKISTLLLLVPGCVGVGGIEPGGGGVGGGVSTPHPTSHTVDCLLLTNKDNKDKDTLTKCQDNIASIRYLQVSRPPKYVCQAQNFFEIDALLTVT